MQYVFIQCRVECSNYRSSKRSATIPSITLFKCIQTDIVHIYICVIKMCYMSIRMGCSDCRSYERNSARNNAINDPIYTNMNKHTVQIYICVIYPHMFYMYIYTHMFYIFIYTHMFYVSIRMGCSDLVIRKVSNPQQYH
jgi:hypothetical protein